MYSFLIWGKLEISHTLKPLLFHYFHHEALELDQPLVQTEEEQNNGRKSVSQELFKEIPKLK